MQRGPVSEVRFAETTGFKACLQWAWAHLKVKRRFSGPSGQVVMTNYLPNLYPHPLGQSRQWPPDPAFLKAVDAPSYAFLCPLLTSQLGHL